MLIEKRPPHFLRKTAFRNLVEARGIEPGPTGANRTGPTGVVPDGDLEGEAIVTKPPLPAPLRCPWPLGGVKEPGKPLCVILGAQAAEVKDVLLIA